MRLVTRADLDGLTSAVLITSMEEIESIELCHPQDITDKKVEITGNDILANLPYHPACGKWFDHHELTESNERPRDGFDGAYALAPSAARLVFDYYGSAEFERFRDLVDETDRLDSATLKLLMSLPWKGNVRELDNVIEHAMILGDGDWITVGDLPRALRQEVELTTAPADNLRDALRAYEKAHILAVLAKVDNDKRLAAELLGVSLSSLYRKIEELGIGASPN